jgi:hypothetical protein
MQVLGDCLLVGQNRMAVAAGKISSAYRWQLGNNRSREPAGGMISIDRQTDDGHKPICIQLFHAWRTFDLVVSRFSGRDEAMILLFQPQRIFQ